MAVGLLSSQRARIGALAGGAALGGLALGAGVVALRRRKKRKARTQRARKAHHRSAPRGRYRKTPRTAGKRRDVSTKRIRYTKNGQPYVILRSGKARFIKKKGAKSAHKRKGGRY